MIKLVLIAICVVLMFIFYLVAEMQYKQLDDLCKMANLSNYYDEIDIRFERRFNGGKK